MLPLLFRVNIQILTRLDILLFTGIKFLYCLCDIQGVLIAYWNNLGLHIHFILDEFLFVIKAYFLVLFY